MNDHGRRPRQAGFAWLAVAAVLMAAACGSSTASPRDTVPGVASPGATRVAEGASGPPSAGPGSPSASAQARVYAGIEADVQALRGLKEKSTLAPTLLDQAGVRDFMTQAFETQLDHTLVAAQSRLLQHLGLLPASASLERLELDLQSSQVIGFYDSDTKHLYLVSETGAVGVMQKLTFSHEFTHALQDQNFGIARLATDAPDQGDRDMARIALLEGDASLAMTQWASQRLSVADLLGLSLSSISSPQTEQLNKAPAILRETLLFPYQQGLTFVQRIYRQGGWAAVDALYSRPPDSTSQILHPELYQAGVKPVVPTLPAVPAVLGSGWSRSMQDTLGEFQLGIWLRGDAVGSADRAAAQAAVSGWGGDRIGLYEGPSGAWAIVLRTVWRTDEGGAAFHDAAAVAAGRNGAVSRFCGDATHVDIVLASDPTTLGAFTGCSGID